MKKKKYPSHCVHFDSDLHRRFTKQAAHKNQWEKVRKHIQKYSFERCVKNEWKNQMKNVFVVDGNHWWTIQIYIKC